MSITSDIKRAVEKKLGEEIVSDHSVSGGCIADSRIIKTNIGNKYFVKTHSGHPGMFINEANGLKELAKPACIKIPDVILADEHFLLLENIEQGVKSRSFFESFGRSFAELHKYTSPVFGFYEDNYIGSGYQYNVAEGEEKLSWSHFYFNKRILAQFRMAEKNGYASNDLSKGVLNIENKIHEIIKGSEEEPCLLHGDLWSGNYLCGADGKAVLIDPAVYYGHREADLAMTKMFGGFPPGFYHSYQQHYPLKKGWEQRENLYLLYHCLNHLNLFGMGYYQSCVQIMNAY